MAAPCQAVHQTFVVLGLLNEHCRRGSGVLPGCLLEGLLLSLLPVGFTLVLLVVGAHDRGSWSLADSKQISKQLGASAMKKIEMLGSHGLENIGGFLAMKIQNGYLERR